MPPKVRSGRNRSEDDVIEIRTNLSTFKPSPTKDIVKATVFYGSLDEGIDSWLKFLDRIATANEWSRERKLNMLPAFLRDHAAVATFVLNDLDISTEKTCLAKVSSDVVKEKEMEMNATDIRGNRKLRNSSVATTVLNDVVISDVVKENFISCELNPKFCVDKIRGLVNERSALMLVDTGSTVNIVNDCFVNRRDVSEVNNIRKYKTDSTIRIMARGTKINTKFHSTPVPSFSPQLQCKLQKIFCK
ncbi:unnamed protein product [Mytilus edulis]|uniref:Uncharacterized protein n=1 Tax=Mytilus edulis TaxID=6550 RepID=A0A8S3RWC8_MYTED|nr:unnamed protein product [Mytilus edulis]